MQLDVLTKAINIFKKRDKTHTAYFLLCRVLKTKCDYFQENGSNYQWNCSLNRPRVVLDPMFGFNTVFHSLTSPFGRGITKALKKEVGGLGPVVG